MGNLHTGPAVMLGQQRCVGGPGRSPVRRSGHKSSYAQRGEVKMRMLTHFLFTFMIISISFTSSAGQENLGTPEGNQSDSQLATEDQAYQLLDQVVAGIGS